MTPRRQDAAIMFRCTTEERDLLKATATRNHLPLSAWIRQVCLQAADKLRKH